MASKSWWQLSKNTLIRVAFMVILIAFGSVIYAMLAPEPRWALPEGHMVLGIAADGAALYTADRSHDPDEFGLTDRARVRVWDMASGKERRRFWADAPPLDDYVLSGDGKFLAMIVRSDAGPELRWADLSSGREQRTSVPNSVGAPRRVSFSPDGTLLAVYQPADGKYDVTVLLYKAADLKLLNETHVPGSTVEIVQENWRWSPVDEKLWVFEPADGGYCLRRIAAKEEDRVVLEGAGPWFDVTADGRTLLTAPTPGKADVDVMLLWDLETAKRRSELRLRPSTIRAADGGPSRLFSRDSRWLAVRFTDRAQEELIGVWEVATGRRCGEIAVGAGPAIFGGRPYAFGPDDLSLLLASDTPARAALYELPSLQPRWDRHWNNPLSNPLIAPDAATVVVRLGSPLVPGHGRVEILDGATGATRAQVRLQDHIQGGGMMGGGFVLDDNIDRLAPGQRSFVVTEEGWLAPSALPAWLAWLPDRFWTRDGRQRRTLHVVDAGTGAVQLRVRTGFQFEPEGTGVLVPGGRALLVHAFDFDDKGKMLRLSPLECYDVPARKPWRWVFGPPLCLAALVLACRWWIVRRRSKLRLTHVGGKDMAHAELGAILSSMEHPCDGIVPVSTD